MQIGADMSDKIDWSIAPDGATHYATHCTGVYCKIVFGKRAYIHTGNYWRESACLTNEDVYSSSMFITEQNPSIRSRLLCKLKVTVNRMAAYVGIL